MSYLLIDYECGWNRERAKSNQFILNILMIRKLCLKS